MKKLLLLLFSIMISLQSLGHRYWQYENNFSPNHHPRVSRIYLITENGSYVDFLGASFTSDNCSDIGVVPSIGATYRIDLGLTTKVQGFGFYTTYGESSRTTLAKLYYSDDNLTWIPVEQYQITTDSGCGEYNRTVDDNSKLFCLGKSLKVINNLIFSKNITVKPFTGISLCHYKNGHIQSQGNVKAGKKDGKWTRWRDNGQMELEEYYKAGKKDGKRTSWSNNGLKLSEFNYKGNQLDGKSITFYENGQMKLQEFYKAGKKDGKWITWRDNGLKQSEVSYEDGDFLNRAKFEYYDNNQLKSVKSYKNELLNGKATFYWDKNGQKFIDGNYQDNRPDGKWVVWSNKGRQKEEINYNDGDLLDRTIFKYSFFTGNLKSKKKYKDGNCISGC